MNEPDVIKLKEIINKQPGAVVSKVLLKKNAGNITLFDFDEGEGLTEHTSAYDAFVYILEGSSGIYISGKQYLLNEGDAIVLPANMPHSLKAITDFKMILVMMKE